MKFLYEEVASSGSKRLLFGCNIKDIKILYGLVQNAKANTPIVSDDSSIMDLRHRLHSMKNEFSIFINEKEDKKHQGANPCPFCEKKLRSVIGVEMHINRVHAKEKI